MPEFTNNNFIPPAQPPQVMQSNNPNLVSQSQPNYTTSSVILDNGEPVSQKKTLLDYLQPLPTNPADMPKQEVHLSRLPEPIIIRRCTQSEITDLRKSCTFKTGLDENLFASKLCILSMVEPNLFSIEVSQAYGGIKDPVDIFNRMFWPNEVATILQAVSECNGLYVTDEDMNEAKNL